MKSQQTQKSAKKKTGRPHGCRLDHPLTAEVIRLNIAKRGDTARCYVGVCSKNTFDSWKRNNRAKWEALRDSGLREHALEVQLSSPAVLEKAMSLLLSKLDSGDLNERTALEVIKYFDARRKSDK